MMPSQPAGKCLLDVSLALLAAQIWLFYFIKLITLRDAILHLYLDFNFFEITDFRGKLSTFDN